MKIGIIGGGYTGLTLAYLLAKKGFNVKIFEKGNELGGLAGGFKLHGTNLEKAYHHLFKTDTDIINLVKELGIEEKLLWHDSSVSIYYDNQIFPFSGPFDLLKFTPLNIFDRIRTGIVMFFLSKTSNWKQFTKVSAYNWMRRFCGKGSMKVIWEPLLKGKFDKYYDKISMAWLWARLHTRAGARKLFDKEKLGYFDGGFNIVTEALLSKLKELGVDIQTSANVEAVEKLEEKIEIKVNGKSETFNKVVATVPSKILSLLINDNSNELKSYFEKLEQINYIGAITSIFSSTQDLSKYYWHNINDTSKPFLVFINHTKLTGVERYEGKNVYYIGAYLPHEHKFFEMDEKEIQRIWFDSLKEIFPEFDETKIIEKHLFKFKFAQHIVDLEYESKIPDYKTPIEGLYLSNFSQIFPEDRGTNYSVREARKLSELITN